MNFKIKTFILLAKLTMINISVKAFRFYYLKPKCEKNSILVKQTNFTFEFKLNLIIHFQKCVSIRQNK